MKIINFKIFDIKEFDKFKKKIDKDPYFESISHFMRVKIKKYLLQG